MQKGKNRTKIKASLLFAAAAPQLSCHFSQSKRDQGPAKQPSSHSSSVEPAHSSHT
jgi:hypothetical protein